MINVTIISAKSVVKYLVIVSVLTCLVFGTKMIVEKEGKVIK